MKMKLLLVCVILSMVPCLFAKPALDIKSRLRKVLEEELRDVTWEVYASSVHNQFSQEGSPSKYAVLDFKDADYKLESQVMGSVAQDKILAIDFGQMAFIHYMLLFGVDLNTSVDVGDNTYTVISVDGGNDFTASGSNGHILVRTLDEEADTVLIALCPSDDTICRYLVDDLTAHIYYDYFGDN